MSIFKIIIGTVNFYITTSEVTLTNNILFMSEEVVSFYVHYLIPMIIYQNPCVLDIYIHVPVCIKSLLRPYDLDGKTH